MGIIYKNGIKYGDSTQIIELTQVQYDALTPAEKSDLTKLYFVIDTDSIMNSIYYDNIKYSGGGGNISEIDDTIIDIDKTWSSNKINLTKQDKLTFDIIPTQNSTNPVTSGGIYNYIDTMITNALTGSY